MKYGGPFVVSIDGTQSEAIPLAANTPGYVPVNIQTPGDLLGTSTVTFEVSMDGTSWYPVYHNNAAVTITMHTTASIPVPSNMRLACVGWAYCRLVLNQAPTSVLELALRVVEIDGADSLVAA